MVWLAVVQPHYLKFYQKLNYKHISAGDIFRKMAEERNMSLLEFSKFAEENEEIDIKIDEKQAELAKILTI